MRAFGRGILPESLIYIYDASEQAKRLYFYALCAGHYKCDSNYIVDRQAYDSYLMLYVQSGSAYVLQSGVRQEIAARSFCLVDCYKPHIYGTSEGCELYWVHFDGVCARELCGIIMESGCVPRHLDRSRRAIIDISEKSEKHGGHLEEAEMHRLITNLLMEFLISAELQDTDRASAIDEVRNYILDNPEKNLTLESLAERARLSPYHFLRQFKESVGMTPHEYLIACRLNVARFYLVSSNYTVKEIAYSCGFSGVSNFCTCFKQKLGMTPSAYRQKYTS